MATPSPRKQNSGGKDDLDRAWHPGDPIPAPEAVYRDGNSAWALFDELSRQQEARFAATAPMTLPGGAPATEPGWAATQPAGIAARAQPRSQARQGVFTLDGAMLVARRNNRVCPRPERWAEFCALLPQRQTPRGLQQPPPAVTGGAWAVTPALTKRLCFREQIEWAEREGVLEGVLAFMQAMAEEDWLHIGED